MVHSLFFLDIWRYWRAHPPLALLRAVAQKLIPGIAENMRILLVDQVDESWLSESARVGDDQDQLTIKDLSVTDRVVKSDVRRERALSEQKREYAPSVS